MDINPVSLLSRASSVSTKQAVLQAPETPVDQPSAWFHSAGVQTLAAGYTASSDEAVLYDMWRLFLAYDGVGLPGGVGLTDLGETIIQLLGFREGNFTNILSAGQPTHDRVLSRYLDSSCPIIERVAFTRVIRDSIKELIETLDTKVKDALKELGWPIDNLINEWIMELGGNEERINQLEILISQINDNQIRLRGQNKANNLNVLHDTVVLIKVLGELKKQAAVLAASIGVLTETTGPDGNPVPYYNHIGEATNVLFYDVEHDGVEQLTVAEKCNNSRASLTEEIRRTFIILASRLSAEAKAELRFDTVAEADPDSWLTANLDLLRQYFVAHVEKIEPASAQPGAQGVEVTLTGQFVEFPEDLSQITIEFAPNSGITLVAGSIVRVSEDVIKFKVNIDASAPITAAGAEPNLTVNFSNDQKLPALLQISSGCTSAILEAERALVCVEERAAAGAESEEEAVEIDESWRPRLQVGLGGLFPANSDNDQVGEASSAGSLSLGGGVERDFDFSTGDRRYVLEAEAGAAGQYQGTFGIEDLPSFRQEQVWLRAWGRALSGDWAPTSRLSLFGNFEQNDIATVANPEINAFNLQTGVSFPWGSLPLYIDLNYGLQTGTQNDGNLSYDWTQQMSGIAFGGRSEAFSGLVGYRYRRDTYGLGYFSRGENLGGAGEGSIEGHGIYGAFYANLGDQWALYGEGGYDFMDRFVDRYDASLTLRLPPDLWSTYLRLGFSNNHLQDLGDYQSYVAAVGTAIPLRSWARDDHWYTPEALAAEVVVRTNEMDFTNPDFRNDTPVSVGLNFSLRFGSQDSYLEQFGESSDTAAAIYQNDSSVMAGWPGVRPAANEGIVEENMPAEANGSARRLFAAITLFSGFCLGTDNRFEELRAIYRGGFNRRGINMYYLSSAVDFETFAEQLNSELQNRTIGRAVMTVARYLLDEYYSAQEIGTEQVQRILKKITELKPGICSQTALAPTLVPALETEAEPSAVTSPVPATAQASHSAPAMDPALNAALREAATGHVGGTIRTARVTSENGSAAPESQALDLLSVKINEIVQPLLELSDGQKVKVIANLHLMPDSSDNWQRGQVTFRVEKADGSRAIDSQTLETLAAALNNANIVIPLNVQDEEELFTVPDFGAQTGILYNFIYE